ncbi:efflux RND transporter periplasmic adaptor subunit [Massilia sp. TS11]|uniref:efflux RND transporter periplasmic adaptor subunit n=1 Tax=Massilia sp. TS11 TaxID=2908003 RepID=UPI001EDB459B|nr:efflux RND transporter periplasmic adaptor subunit [Massilia sp. TS11]MCG2583975.1 efflux RND transporter periplasmic adaptor subunit [Massilia sp. TS11]
MSTTQADPFLDGVRRPWWRQPWLWAALLALALAGAGIAWWQLQRAAAEQPRYRTVAAELGDVAHTVTANGSLQPTRSVNIGSELSGTVTRVLVDVNDVVKRGQVLVELDTAKLNDQVQRSRAALTAAEAAVTQAVATRVEAEASLARLEEVARLSNGKVPSKAELDTGRANVARAKANELNARAGVNSAKAALSTDLTNLSKAAIRAPIEGVILSRNVDPGNAVAASLQAVTLFTIAEDLKQLKLQVNIDEADVGTVQLGQKAQFSVSSYPNRPYPARITRVAYGATITDNVVTYPTQLEVDNRDLSLRPGMTATATIRTADRHNVLLVPNSALRFTPAGTAAAASAGGGGLVSSLVPRMPQRAPRKAGAANGAEAAARKVWVLRDGKAVEVAISTGISDGRMTEVVGGDLKPGMLVITEQRAAAK